MNALQEAYVVGAGISGCVIARELAESGWRVTVADRRDSVGGNMRDHLDRWGVRVHDYGPHIFHTHIDAVWEYVNQLCDWEPFELTCGAMIGDVCVPTAFDLSAVDTFFPEEARAIKAALATEFPGRATVPVMELMEAEDAGVRGFAEFLWEHDYAPYTAKQWGMLPEEVNREVLARVPVRLTYGSRYFEDPYQVMPVGGYEALFDALLGHSGIDLMLGVDALNHVGVRDGSMSVDGRPYGGVVVWTGPLDELFGCRLGRLPYRSLRFEWRHEEAESLQPMPVVAYPEEEGFTRITEYKKLPPQDVCGTTYAVEWPVPYEPEAGGEPYYPIATDESAALYARYRCLVDGTRGLVTCGRLANFKYYDMDDAIANALRVSEDILGGKHE